MKILLKSCVFFENRRGGAREKHLFRNYRIIFINCDQAPAERLPFSEEYVKSGDLLILYIGGVEAQTVYALTPEQAGQIVDFISCDDRRPVIVAGADGTDWLVGRVLNWYCNCYLKDNYPEYRLFRIFNSRTGDNVYFCRQLLDELQRRHGSWQIMLETIRLRRKRLRLLSVLTMCRAVKYDWRTPPLAEWFRKLDCISFSEKAVSGNPDAIRFAIGKFLRAGCGITRYDGRILAVDIYSDGRMQEIFAQMCKLAMPESYAVKQEDDEKFFAPFTPYFHKRACRNSRYFLKLVKNSPEDAAIYLLAETQFKTANIYGKQGIVIQAKKFDALYAGISDRS